LLVLLFFHVRSKIFELEGIDAESLSEEDKSAILEEILKEAETRFDYTRQTQTHPKFACLNKYLFKWSTGKKEETGSVTEKKLTSYVNNLKKGGQLGLELLGKGSSSGQSAELEAAVSESYTTLNNLFRDLGSWRSKLSKNQEDVVFVLTQAQAKKDPTWGKKEEELGAAKRALENWLTEIRNVLVQGMPEDKLGDHNSKVADLSFLVDKSSARDKASKQVLKTVKTLLEG
jgi:hypothetical protein